MYLLNMIHLLIDYYLLTKAYLIYVILFSKLQLVNKYYLVIKCELFT